MLVSEGRAANEAMVELLLGPYLGLWPYRRQGLY